MAEDADRDNGDWFVCPHCGAEVSVDASACPECGSDETTGWREDAGKWAAGIPTGYSEEDEFDYERYVRREFGRRTSGFLGLPWWFWLLPAGLLILSLLVLLAGGAA